MIQKKIVMAVAAAALAFSGLAAAATNSSGTLTADNEYSFYTGNATGSNLALVGSGNDWTIAQTFSFNSSPGDYLYVAATNWGGPRGWQGVFNTPVGTTYTDSSSWVVTAVSSLTVTASVIAGANWVPTNELNTYPWGSKVGNPNAQWIWGSSTDTALFRTGSVVASVPEPETYAMLLAGLGLMGTIARRRKNKQA